MGTSVPLSPGVGHRGICIKFVPVALLEQEEGEHADDSWILDSGVHVLVRHKELVPMGIQRSRFTAVLKRDTFYCSAAVVRLGVVDNLGQDNSTV